MSAPLRVIHIYKAFPPVRGGIEGHIALLTRLLSQRGVSAEVLCSREPGTLPIEERDGVHVRRCAAAFTLASTPLPPMLPWALHRSQADIVHLHLPWPPGEVAWLLGGRARLLVVTVHCEAVRQARLARLLSPLTRLVLGGAHRILVTGAFMRDTPALAPHRKRVRVVPLGVDLNHFRPGLPAADPLPDAAHPRILFVGRLRHYKGLDVLAAALPRLPSAHLVVVGDGSERGTLEAALRVNGCRERAHLLGEVDDDRLLRLFQTADVAVLPSTSNAEAFGLAIAEAQACGVPAVTTDVGTATAQTVANGISGRVVPPNNSAALAEALAWCLDPMHASTRRQAARAHAEANLCASQMAATVHAVYTELTT